MLSATFARYKAHIRARRGYAATREDAMPAFAKRRE